MWNNVNFLSYSCPPFTDVAFYTFAVRKNAQSLTCPLPLNIFYTLKC